MTVKTKAKFRLKATGRDSYLKLVMAFPLASIKSDEQLQEAHSVMDQLLAEANSRRERRCTSTRSATWLPHTRTNTTP